VPVAWPVNMHRRLETGRSETVEVASIKVWTRRYYTDQRFGKITGICVVNTVYVYVQLGELLDPGAPFIFVRIHFINCNTAGEALYPYNPAGKSNLEGGGSRHSGSPAIKEETNCCCSCRLVPR